MSSIQLQGQINLQGAIIFSNIISVDSDAQVYFDAVATNGGSIGVLAKTAVTNFIIGLKADGLWSSIYDIGLFAGVDQIAGALVKVKTPLASRLLVNNNFTSGAYSPTGSTAGFKGNGSNTYLNTGFNPGTTGLNPQSNSLTNFGVFAYWAGSETSTRYVMGIQQTNTPLAGVGLGWSGGIPNKEGGVIGSLNLTTELSPLTSPVSLDGSSFVTTNSNRSQVYYNKGTQVSTPITATGAAFPSQSIVIGAMGVVGSTPYLWSTRYIRGYAITQGLNATQAQQLSTRWNTLMTSFGANTY
jgi:hypothetical protein